MKKLPIIALFILMASFEVTAQLKIGYTNPEVILSQLPEVQEIDAEITLLLERKDSLLAIKAIPLQKEFNDYDAEKENLSPDQRRIREQALLEKNQAFEQERQNSLNEVQQRQIALLRPVENKIYAEIRKVANTLGLDMVLNEGSVNGGAVIFYASEDQINITEMVLENLKKS
ncbi:MAG: OmpH family outer membrane protein [Balneola sp.]